MDSSVKMVQQHLLPTHAETFLHTEEILLKTKTLIVDILFIIQQSNLFLGLK